MTKNEEGSSITDHDLVQMLDLAPKPTIPADAQSRLLAKLSAQTQTANVKVLPARQKHHYWLAGLPLAASLLLGVYLGATGRDQNLFPGFTTDALVTELAGDLSTGVDEAEIFSEDSQS